MDVLKTGPRTNDIFSVFSRSKTEMSDIAHSDVRRVLIRLFSSRYIGQYIHIFRHLYKATIFLVFPSAFQWDLYYITDTG